MSVYGSIETPEPEPQPDQAQPTSSLWGQLFGLGPLFRMVSDPQMMQNAIGMMQAIAAGAAANQRLEAKLDFLLRKQGYDPEEIASSAPGRSGPALIPDGRTIPGAGATAAPGLAADHGIETDQGTVAPGYFESGGY